MKTNEIIFMCDYPYCKLQADKSIIWIHTKVRSNYCLKHF